MNEEIEFAFATIEEMRIGGEAKFKFDTEDIDNLLEAKKGPYTFLILSLLCPNIRSQTIFHQDHIHPTALFNSKLKRDMGLNDKEWDVFNSQKDTLPNLQFWKANRILLRVIHHFQSGLRIMLKAGEMNIQISF